MLLSGDSQLRDTFRLLTKRRVLPIQLNFLVLAAQLRFLHHAHKPKCWMKLLPDSTIPCPIRACFLLSFTSRASLCCNLLPLSSEPGTRPMQRSLLVWPDMELPLPGTSTPCSTSTPMLAVCCRLRCTLCATPLWESLCTSTGGCKPASVTLELEERALDKHTLTRTMLAKNTPHNVTTLNIHITANPSKPVLRSLLTEALGTSLWFCL